MRTAAEPVISRFAYLRYAGQGHDIRVDLPSFPLRPGYAAEFAARFEQAYLAKYGYRQPGAVVEAVDWYIVASVASASAGAHRARSWRSEGSGPYRRGTRKAYFPEDGGFVDCAVIDRSALPVGEIVEGPAIIEEAEATTLLLPRSTASVSPRGHLVITLEG
jgi:N-methylhydantoinase A